MTRSRSTKSSSRGSRRCTRHAATAGLTPERERLADAHVRAVRPRGREAVARIRKTRLGEINQELAVAFTDFSNKVLADENTWVVLDLPSDLAGLPDRCAQPTRRRRTNGSSTGKWAVVNTRSSVDPFLSASSRRDLRENGLEGIQEPRRQRRRQRHQRDDREDRQAARRARGAPGLRVARALAHVRHDGQGPEGGPGAA